MSTTTIRVTAETQDRLRTVPRQKSISIKAVVQKAVSEYRRRQMLVRGNEAYAALRADPAAWAADEEERQSREATLADGIDAE